MIFNKSVDAIVVRFDKMLDDLDELIQFFSADNIRTEQGIAELKARVKDNNEELDRARRIKDKLLELIK